MRNHTSDAKTVSARSPSRKIAWSATTPLARATTIGSPLGSTFVDQGHDLHMVRNNSTTDVADVYVVSFVPAGFSRRIDEPNPNPTICPN